MVLVFELKTLYFPFKSTLVVGRSNQNEVFGIINLFQNAIFYLKKMESNVLVSVSSTGSRKRIKGEAKR